MDPNETLRQIRELLAVQHQYEDDTTTAGVAARRLAEREITEHAEALDDWLSRGGFLPDAWRGQTLTRKDVREAPAFREDDLFRFMGRAARTE